MIHRLKTLAVVCAMTMTANAQTVMTVDEFKDSVTVCMNEFSAYISKKEYSKAIVPLKKKMNLLETVKVADGDSFIGEDMMRLMEGNDLYDLACCYARIGKKNLAVEALRKAIEYGWNNYQNLKWDVEANDLVSIAKNKEVQDMLESLRLQQPIVKLQMAGPYKKEELDSIPQFLYQPKEFPNLVEVRKYFNLDAVAGDGDELSKIKNLLTYCHNLIVHDGSNYAFAELDAIDLYHYHKVTGNGINCRQMAIVMMEMYLAMGFPSRIVSCMPMDSNDYDSHVINVVWSETLNKWLYVDPSFNAWVMDENGVMLSVAEVRERLIDGRPLVLNEEANHNNENKQTKEYYLETYMAKNLYVIACPMKLMFNAEPRYRNSTINYMQLVPSGFEPYTFPQFTTTDSAIFWQAPVK